MGEGAEDFKVEIAFTESMVPRLRMWSSGKLYLGEGG